MPEEEDINEKQNGEEMPEGVADHMELMAAAGALADMFKGFRAHGLTIKESAVLTMELLKQTPQMGPSFPEIEGLDE